MSPTLRGNFSTGGAERGADSRRSLDQGRGKDVGVNRNASLRPKQIVLGYLIYQCTCRAYISHTTLNNGNIQMGSKFPLVNFSQTVKGQEERFGFGGPKKKKEKKRERERIHLGMPSACLQWKKEQRDKGVEGERPGQCACAPRASF